MPQDNTSSPDSFYSPEDIEDAIDRQNQEAVQGARTPQQMSMAVANQGFNQAANQLQAMTGNPNVGDPRTVQARKISDAMKAVLQDATANAPEDEDPLAKNLRVSQMISQRMINISPQVAMQALQKSAAIQEAQAQQAKLTTQTQNEAQAGARLSAADKANPPIADTIVFAKQGQKDINGMPTGLVSMGSLSRDDPDYTQKALKIINDAKDNGDTVLPMTPDKFINSKDQTAIVRGQFMMQKDQADNAARLQDIIAKGANGTMDSRSTAVASRVTNAVSEGVASLHNITELPLGSNTGFFGIGAVPGHSLIQSGMDTLRNQMTSEDVRRYNVMATGLANNLAAIESAGLMPRGTLVTGMDRVIFRSGDDTTPTGVVALTKLAEARQIIERGSQTLLNNPRYPQALKDQMNQDLARLQVSIPFTMDDVTALAKKTAKGDTTTIQDVINDRLKKEQGITDTNPTPSGPQYDDQTIAQDMNKFGATRDQILAGYKAHGFTAKVAPNAPGLPAASPTATTP